MAATALRLLVGVAAISALTGTATAQNLTPTLQSRETLVPDNRPAAPLFRGTTAVASGFSGNVLEKPVLEKGARRLPDVAYRFIDPDGVSVTLTGISDMGFAPNGHEISTLPYDTLKARDVGQVFGIAINDKPQPDLYLAATSAYGLQIVGPDANNDLLPDRLLRGQPDARWMAGQFGPHPDAGPGSVWRVDGMTGQVSLFANIRHDGKDNSGPGLGNIAYDRTHEQLFVSDLESGLIHRLNLKGEDVQQWDHGVDGRPVEILDPVIMPDITGTDITSPAFDITNPDTWGFAEDVRRVWGLAVHGGRLYYSVARGKTDRPEIWSLAIDSKTGRLLDDTVRWELTLPEDLPRSEVSDIAFTARGEMLLAQRGPRKGAFDYKQMSMAGEAAIIRFVLEDPEDPAAKLTPSDWIWMKNSYDTGFAMQGRAGTGGLALGPGYDGRGRADMRSCRGTLWTTGEELRNRTDLQEALKPGGALPVDGLQAQPVDLRQAYNSPPWVSYFLDQDKSYPQDDRSGWMGDVEVLGCRGGGGRILPPLLASNTTGLPNSPDTLPQAPDLCPGGSCLLVLCLINPSLCFGDNDPAICADVSADVRCDTTTGQYVVDINAQNQTAAALDRLKMLDPSGTIAALPAQTSFPATTTLPLTGLSAGQTGQIDLCAFDSAQQSTGQPYDCCNTTVNFRIPEAACEVKEQ
ncbi:hypothetical protein [Profundibacter sp.]